MGEKKVTEKGKLQTKVHHAIIHGLVEFDDGVDGMHTDRRCQILRLKEQRY